jgi:hypothetical protein
VIVDGSILRSGDQALAPGATVPQPAQRIDPFCGPQLADTGCLGANHNGGTVSGQVRGSNCTRPLVWLELHRPGTLGQVNDFAQLSLAATSVPGFVGFWRPYGPGDDVYAANINHGGTVTTDNVVTIMHWKAGPRFRARAEEFARAVPASVFNDARLKPPLSDEDLRDQYDLIRRHLRDKGLATANRLIWPIFLCHVAQPLTTPMYDVNVWRAWGHIAGWIEPKHYRLIPQTFPTYLGYRGWFNGLTSTYGIEPRHLDQALVAYGRFLADGWDVPFR